MPDGYETYMTSLLTQIERHSQKSFLRNEFMAVLQLYYDGLIENSYEDNPESSWKEQRRVLEEICLGYKEFFGTYYFEPKSGKMQKSISDAKSALLDNRQWLELYGGNRIAKSRHLGFHDKETRNFSELIRLNVSRISLDTIVAISSGGFEPAFVALYLYDKASFRAVRYSIYFSNDSKVLLPKNQPANYLKDAISGRKVLLVDDVLVTGETFMEVSSYLDKMKPKELTCSVVYLMGTEKELYYPINRIRSPLVKELDSKSSSDFDSLETFFFTMRKNQRSPLHFLTLKR